MAWCSLPSFFRVYIRLKLSDWAPLKIIQGRVRYNILHFVHGLLRTHESWDMLYINSVNSLPVLMFLALLTWSEFSKIFHSDLWQDHTFVFLFLLVVICGFFLNASLFACLKHNTALTTSVVGTLKGILAAFVSLFGFDKPKVGHQFLVGLSMNLVGALSYIHAKLLAQRAK